MILFLLFEITSPAVEEALSDGTEVAGMVKYFVARVYMIGNFGLLHWLTSSQTNNAITGSIEIKRSLGSDTTTYEPASLNVRAEGFAGLEKNQQT